ncbi:hypothetical protein GCM10010988_14420 [Cnuibacter physcomitrellae]|uniref:hypothetical protein n=1 Tax=Cnuibacter physcomitrellae TaxID=1619308 RepID=UPI0012F4C89D|nr:hypothetical protein [Cnuibacter physcomitrellae]GGI37528.1 hypothetical protein GCM10010988_14420 [Cnuibacter physcomitrellae]
MQRSRRVVVVVGALIGAALGLAGCAGSDGGGSSDATTGETHPPVAEATRTDVAAFDPDTVSDGGPLTTDLVDPAWLDATATATGIPRRALEGYAGAALAVADTDAGCHLGWNTLAAIGWVESHHGTIFDGEIGPDGRTTAPIFGVQLNGGGFQEIPDTDGGAVDGDTEWDRAVGPMQIVPATWAAWAAEANGDGVPDIHSIDDASLTAADYLCYTGGDLSTEAGWRDAIAGYNESPAYLDEVLDYAIRYAQAADQG